MASDPKQLTATSPAAELAKLGAEQLHKLGLEAKVIEGPVANASNAIVMQVANDAIIVFGRPRPMFSATGEIAHIAITETTAIIHMSMLTLKDLHWAIGDQIQRFESTHGEIVTDAMKLRAAAAKK